MPSVILVAGGEPPAEKFGEGHQLPNKAFLDINGRPMIEYVLDAMGNSSYVDKIILIGPYEELGRFSSKVDRIIEDSGSLMGNIRAGVRSLPEDTLAVISTADIPLITSQIVDDFIERSIEKKAEICYPIIKKEYFEEKYPGMKRTYVRIKEGVYVGGNMMLINTSLIDKFADIVEKTIKYRKSMWHLAGLVGLRCLLKFLIKTLTIADVERRVSSIFGCEAAAIDMPYPEIGVDVDKPTDLRYVRRILKGRC